VRDSDPLVALSVALLLSALVIVVLVAIVVWLL